jgi:hypothetical protein
MRERYKNRLVFLHVFCLKESKRRGRHDNQFYFMVAHVWSMLDSHCLFTAHVYLWSSDLRLFVHFLGAWPCVLDEFVTWAKETKDVGKIVTTDI